MYEAVRIDDPTGGVFEMALDRDEALVVLRAACVECELFDEDANVEVQVSMKEVKALHAFLGRILDEFSGLTPPQPKAEEDEDDDF